MIQLELPYPPSINHYWRRVGPRTIISRGGRQFRQNVLVALTAMGIKPLAGRLAVEIEVYPPDARRRDIDNVQKALLDALQHARVYNDDSQIVWLLTKRAKIVRGGKVIVRITEKPG